MPYCILPKVPFIRETLENTEEVMVKCLQCSRKLEVVKSFNKSHKEYLIRCLIKYLFCEIR